MRKEEKLPKEAFNMQPDVYFAVKLITLLEFSNPQTVFLDFRSTMLARRPVGLGIFDFEVVLEGHTEVRNLVWLRLLCLLPAARKFSANELKRESLQDKIEETQSKNMGPISIFIAQSNDMEFCKGYIPLFSVVTMWVL